MLVQDSESVEAALDARDPSRLRIDIRVHAVGIGLAGPDSCEIKSAIRDGFREVLRESEVERLRLAVARPPNRRSSVLRRLRGFVACAAVGSLATLTLMSYHPRPRAIAGLDALGSAEASPGSQSIPTPHPPESLAEGRGPAEREPGPDAFGLHQQ
jgi:hypothetical protein